MRQLSAIGLLLILVLPVSAGAATYWTSVGSAGTPDLAFAAPGYNGAAVDYSSVATNNMVIRYNVTDTTGSNTPGWTTFEIGTAGISGLASVSAGLYAVNPCTGASTLICQINATTSCNNTCTFSSTTFDFSSHAYYITATLGRTAIGGNPQLFYLSIH